MILNKRPKLLSGPKNVKKLCKETFTVLFQSVNVNMFTRKIHIVRSLLTHLNFLQRAWKKNLSLEVAYQDSYIPMSLPVFPADERLFEPRQRHKDITNTYCCNGMFLPVQK